MLDDRLLTLCGLGLNEAALLLDGERNGDETTVDDDGVRLRSPLQIIDVEESTLEATGVVVSSSWCDKADGAVGITTECSFGNTILVIGLSLLVDTDTGSVADAVVNRDETVANGGAVELLGRLHDADEEHASVPFSVVVGNAAC